MTRNNLHSPQRFFVLVLSGTILSICTLGCTSNSPSTSNDEHPEHVIPEHRPANFAAAIEELQRRFAILKNKPQSDAPFIRELHDIVRWLPEIAGDSELRKPQWELVQDRATELERTIAPLLVPRRELTASEHDRLLAIVSELQNLVPHSLAKKVGAP